MNWNNSSDPLLVKAIGDSVRSMRLNKNMSQAQLAEMAGLDRSTISQFENGRSATLLTLVQILRALGKLEVLNAFTEEPVISPLQMVKLRGKTRKRASGKIKPEQEGLTEW